MASLGINTVRIYTPPRRDLLDEAARRGPARHGRAAVVAARRVSRRSFAEADDPPRDRREGGRARRPSGGADLRARQRDPAGVVRWHGRMRVERFLRDLYEDAKAASPDSLFTYVNFPPTEFLDLSFFDVCAFNVYLHREAELRAYLARLQHIAGQKPLLLAEAGADSIREGEDGQAEITAMHIRAAFEEGACGAMAFAWTDEWWRGGHPVDDWEFGLVDRDRRPKPAALAVAAAFADAPFSPRARSAPGRACRSSSAPTTPPTRSKTACDRSSGSPIPTTRSSSSTTARRDRTERDRPPLRARARDRHAERRPERGAQRRPRRGDRRDRRVHRRRHARRSRLADVPRPAVPHLGRRRLRRTERRAGRRSADGAVHRARARRPDARAARRSHRRARARLQHGVPPRRAAGDRRLQPHLPARRRRCGRVLAAAGAGLEDRVRVGGARLAPPPLVGDGVLAAAGRLRRRRDLADGAPPGQVPRRPDAVARPDLQPAAVRALAVGHAHQRGRLGHGGVPVGLPHRRPPVRVPAALDQMAGHLVRPDHRRRPWSPRPASTCGRRRCCSAPASSASLATIAKNIAYALRSEVDSLPRPAALVPGGRRVPALHPAVRAAARPHSRRRCRRRKWRSRRPSRRPAAGRGRRWARPGARCC